MTGVESLYPFLYRDGDGDGTGDVTAVLAEVRRSTAEKAVEIVELRRRMAVEYVHPVIVGKRALPAISLTADVATVTGIAEREGIDAIFAHQLRYLADPADIALGISADGDNASVLAGLMTAKNLGLLTIALVGTDGGRVAAANAADHLLTVASDDPCVIKELQVTTYHILWELVHVFFEQPGVLDPGVVT